MTRSEYIKDIEKRISKLSPREIDEALDFYNEILDERGIAEEDLVPDDMPSSRTASFEILRDASIEDLAYEEENEKRKPSTLGSLALWVMALPIAFPLVIGLLLICFALVAVVLSVLFAIAMAGLGVIGASIYELVMSGPDLIRAIYLIGSILISIALLIFAGAGAKGFFGLIRNMLLKYKNKRS